MQHLSYILLFCLSIQGCRSKQSGPDQDIQEVIARCIIETTGKGDTARYFYKLRPFMLGFDKPEEVTRYNDSIKFELDTAAVYLLVNDSLDHVYNDDKAYLKTYIHQYNCGMEKLSSDTLKQDVSLLTENIDISDLEKRIQFPIKTKEQGINDRLRITGRFYFSKPVFNATKTKGAIHLNFFITRHIGYGEIFILEKTGTSWKVIKRERTWIS